MSYYIGFRHGWVRLGPRTVGGYDTRLYHHWPRGRRVGAYKVWVQ